MTVKVIAVVGLTGGGKTTFVNQAAGANLKVGHTLASCTDEIQTATTCIDGQDVIFVDTPGFDDTEMADIEIVRKLSSWLNANYQNSVGITGMILVRNIVDNRVSGSERRTENRIKAVLGAQNFDRLVLVTTFWDKEPWSSAFQRETELKTDDKFWKNFIRGGATTERHYNNSESAKRIARQLLPKHPTYIEHQHELVARNYDVSQTSVGQQITSMTNERVQKLQQESSNLRTELSQHTYNSREYNDIQEDIRLTDERISSGSRVRLYLAAALPMITKAVIVAMAFCSIM